ncbi:MAG TPA: DinB family protein [Gemmatimonadaceae bacterium]|nr:DinB family protein [Gemmatimonadaceae bacterium]
MEIARIEPFLEYYGRLRQRTIRVAECIPRDRLEWAPRTGAFSFGDILRHIGAIERWVFAENAHRRPNRYPGHGRELAEGYDDVLSFLQRTHAETLALLGELGPADLRLRCELPSGATIPVWKWLRALAEHEVHHRGQLYLMLRLLDVPTPPMWGLTSEQVRARGLSRDVSGS